MMYRQIILSLLSLFCLTNIYAQSDWYQQRWSDSRINLEVDKVLNPTRVLYVAAHPDDENTRLIAWLVNKLHAKVAYLSITNGAGGQNLVGGEIGTKLGLIREQELYAARRIDGGEQYFTAAEDFGFSKSHEETFEKWDKEKTLEEVVYRIRKFKPDIIITRFSPTVSGFRSTHGHHTASAILATEAFEAAADPERFKHQLKELEVWKTKTIYWNTGYWSFGSQEKLDSTIEADPKKYVKINVETYIPELGMTSSEIAAESRSMHKSQGFGSMARYGENFEYLQLLKGDPAGRAMLSPFYQNLSSYAYSGLERAKHNTRSKSAALLSGTKRAQLDKKLSEDQVLRLKEIWLKSLGLRLMITAENYIIAGGNKRLELELIHYGDTSLMLESLKIEEVVYPLNQKVENGQLISHAFEHNFRKAYTQPQVIVNISGMSLEIPLIYRTSDPVEGEIIQPVFVTQSAMIEIEEEELILINQSSGKVSLKISPWVDADSLVISSSDFEKRGGQAVHRNIRAGQTINTNLDIPSEGDFEIALAINGDTVRHIVKGIYYDHLPRIYQVREGKIAVHRIKAVCTAKKVAYVMGAGDQVSTAISALGAEVELIDPFLISGAELKSFDAVVFGIRVLNTLEDIDGEMYKFYHYVKEGGTLIMQYNTSRNLKTHYIGFTQNEIELSRGRVTEENAAVRIAQDHIVLHQPNLILPEDWEGWVQERGLYFPEKWPADYAAPLSMNDRGEDELKGSLLIRKEGKGYFVYTGLSFFRELPAGVEGAYKLWANLLSL